MAIMTSLPAFLRSNANDRTWVSTSERKYESPMKLEETLASWSDFELGMTIFNLRLLRAASKRVLIMSLRLISSMTVGVVYGVSLSDEGSSPAMKDDVSKTIAFTPASLRFFSL